MALWTQLIYPRGANPSLTITDDDDAPTVTLMLAPASVRESDDTSSTDVSEHVSTVTASLSHPSSEATTVTVSAAAVSPAVSGDFTLSGNRVLTIPARQTRSTGTVTVTANDNNVDAADKDVTVSAAAANTQGIAGNPPDLTLMIRDDEATPKVALVLGANSIDEDAGSTTVKATIPYPSSHATVVTITAAPGDFTVGGTLTIPAGQTESGTATLTAVDNETDAEDKTVTVLATAANGHGIVNPDGVQLTIEDDDPAPVVTLVLTSSPIREKDESGTPGVSEHVATVTAVLDRPSSKPTTVTVSAAAVSPAVAGDFALSTNRTLAIAAGQTASTGTVTIRANDNNVDAPDKEVTVSGTAVNTQGITPPADVRADDFGRRAASDSHAHAFEDGDGRGRQHGDYGDGIALPPVERGDDDNGFGGCGGSGGGRGLHPDRRHADDFGRADGEHRHGDDRAGGQ